MDTSAESPGQPQHETAQNTADGVSSLACTSCRRRKLRCSRELPTCHQCRRAANDCTYESKRGKPGMKAGSIETLHRRLDTLEQKLEDQRLEERRLKEQRFEGRVASESQDGTRTRLTPSSEHTVENDSELAREAFNALTFFAKEFRKFNKSASNINGARESDTCAEVGVIRSRKRRCAEPDSTITPPLSLGTDDTAREIVFQVYFSHVHPWIPMIHEGRLRRRLQDKDEAKKLEFVVNAILLASSKYLEKTTVASQTLQVPNAAELSRIRDQIVTSAMKGLSVENLQALVVVVFTDIGNGNASQAWSLLASLTRTVEYLQLTSESDGTDQSSLFRSYASLASAQDWVEEEERRRVFWNVFQLDRFCSTTMGWNTSLTADDVHRTLPCDGISWRKEEAVATPYLGIWDKAAGRIGNPIAFLPSHYTAAPTTNATEGITQTPSEASASPNVTASTNVDMSNVGAFAYCIEATESLSRVSTYFLQQKANLRDASDLTSWMTRFKELDLRLVHWKMLLPQKWKADMARQSRRMDPNLTVAHVTHNASMILLHQIIAFPPMELPIRNRLPSFLSAETCQSAAVEIATITENYLRFAPPTLPTSNQFAFCVYIAARVLIISWKYHVPDSESQESIAPAFWSLKLSLDEMAKRWVGSGREAVLQHCLAAKYSRKLMQLFSVCQNSGFLAIEVTGYTAEIDHSLDSEALGDDDRASEQNRQAQNESQTLQEQIGTYINKNVEHTGGYDFREATNADQALQAMPVVGARTSMGPCVSDQANHAPDVRRRAALGEELGSISQMLLDQQFMGMDRVISYDDGMFGTDYDGVGW